MKVYEKFDVRYIAEIFPKLLSALPVTFFIAGMSILFGMLLGLMLAWGKVCRFRALNRITDALTVFLKGFPTVVLIYLFYFGLPGILTDLFKVNIGGWNREVFVIAALAVELSVTSSEMFRSAYNSLDRGQMEAAHALGMTGWQRFRRIVVPQGLYVILPNLGNTVLATIQATALVFTLGIMDIMGKARSLDAATANMKTLEAYAACALLYWGISVAISRLFRRLEEHFGKGMQRTAEA